MREGNRNTEQGIGMESEFRGGDWRPFFFFGSMSFAEDSGNALTETLKVFVEARPSR
jgi:hypothetical protein